jgi:hypothetical protein
MSTTKSLVALRDLPRLRPKRSHLQLAPALVWLAAVFVHSLDRGRGGHPPGVPEIDIDPFVVVQPSIETPFPIQLGPPEWIAARGRILARVAPLVAPDEDELRWYLQAQAMAVARTNFYLQRLGQPAATTHRETAAGSAHLPAGVRE